MGRGGPLLQSPAVYRRILAYKTASKGSSSGRLLVLSLRKDVRFTRVTIKSRGPPTVDRLNWTGSWAWNTQRREKAVKVQTTRQSRDREKCPTESGHDIFLSCIYLPSVLSLRTLLLSCRRRSHPGQHDSHTHRHITHPLSPSPIKEGRIISVSI